MVVLWPVYLARKPVVGFPFWKNYYVPFGTKENDYVYWDRSKRKFVWKKREGVLRIGKRVILDSLLHEVLGVSYYATADVEGFALSKGRVVYFFEGKDSTDRYSVWVEATPEGELTKVIYNGKEVEVPIGLDAPDFAGHMSPVIEVDLLQPPHLVGSFLVREGNCLHTVTDKLVTGFPFVYCSCDNLPSLLYACLHSTYKKISELESLRYTLNSLPTEEFRSVAVQQLVSQIEYGKKKAVCPKAIEALERELLAYLF